MREQLDALVAEMVDKGIRWEEARREFDRRFLARVIAQADGNLCKAAVTLRVHRNTLTRKIRELKIKSRPA